MSKYYQKKDTIPVAIKGIEYECPGAELAKLMPLAKQNVEDEWMENNDPQDIDFLKVPHHGSFNASLDALLAATTPEYAAITCSKKNPADDVTMETLQKYGVNVFQTRDGQITAITDGKNIKVIQD